jgi:hypothetical protein
MRRSLAAACSAVLVSTLASPVSAGVEELASETARGEIAGSAGVVLVDLWAPW